MSFTLELRFSGIVLIDQHAAGPNPGLFLFMPSHPRHQTILSFNAANGSSGASSVRLKGPHDLFAANASGAVHSLADFARLSMIEGRGQSIHPAWFSTSSSPSGLEALLRLPLADSIDADPKKETVELEFTNSAGGTWSHDVAGEGIISITINTPTISIGGEILDPHGASALEVSLTNFPVPPSASVIPPNNPIPHHHIHAMYKLLVAPGTRPPVAPNVFLHRRIPAKKPVPIAPAGPVAVFGGDPAQCTPGGI